MKIYLITLFLIFSTIVSHSQDQSEKRLLSEIATAKTLQDTIAAWFTYQITSQPKNENHSVLIEKLLKPKYPIWAEIENFKLSKDTAYNLTTLEKFVTNCSDSALQKYALTLLRIKNIELGIIKNIDETILINTEQNHKNLVFQNYLKAYQLFYLRDADALTKCMKAVVDDTSITAYPALRMRIIGFTLNTLLSRITEDTSPYIDIAIALSESLNEYTQRPGLYNCKLIYLDTKGDTKNAMKAALKFIEINEINGDLQKSVIGYLNLSTFHQEQGQFNEAYELIYKARDIAASIKDTLSVANTYASEAHVKMNEKKYPEAITLLKKYRTINQNALMVNATMNLVNIIDCYYTTSQLDSAYRYFQIMQEIDPQNLTGNLSYAKTFVSKYLVQKRQYSLAQEYIDDALADAEAYEDLSSKSIVLKAQSELDEALGNYKKALQIFKQHFSIEQDFRNENLAAATTKIQLESDFKQEKKIIALTNEKKTLVIKSQRNQALLLGGVALITALSAICFYLFLRRKNKEIKTKNIQLEDLNNVKDTLFQIIGHDLKKPSINFRNVSKNINYLLDREDYHRLRLLGQEVDQDANSLYNLTDNLLNWALMQKDTISIRPEKININEIVQFNIDLFLPTATRKNITLKNFITTDIYSQVDKNSLDTIIRNLIDNAIKYTPEQGFISLDCKITEGMVRVIISDSGVGIDQNTIDAISSEKIIISERGTNGEQGSGIGLQLVKKLIVKNAGILNINSKNGNGSIIAVDLPMAS